MGGAPAACVLREEPPLIAEGASAIAMRPGMRSIPPGEFACGDPVSGLPGPEARRCGPPVPDCDLASEPDPPRAVLGNFPSSALPRDEPLRTPGALLSTGCPEFADAVAAFPAACSDDVDAGLFPMRPEGEAFDASFPVPDEPVGERVAAPPMPFSLDGSGVVIV
jgi:hypothetical protein